MASGKNPDIRTDIEEELQCSVCLEIFDKPKLLPKCLHSFCEKCLKKLIFTAADNQHFLRCPNCREISEVPKGDVSGLPNNHIIQNIISRLSVHDGDVNELRCGGCTVTDDTTAVSFCGDCGHFLCNQCTDAHRRFRIFEKHCVITVKEAKEKGLQSIPQKHPLMCEQHPKNEVLLYCNGCEILVCHLCLITIHKNHDFEDIDKTYERKKAEVEQNISNIVPKINDSLQSVDYSQEELRINAEDKKSGINKMFDSFVEVFEKRRHKLLNDVEQIQEKKMKVLSLQKEDLKSQLVHVQSIEEFNKSAVDGGNSSEFLSVVNIVKNQLKELSDKQMCEIMKPSNKISFHYKSNPEELVNQLKEFVNNNFIYPAAYGPNSQVLGLDDVTSTAAVNIPSGYIHLSVKSFNIEEEPLNIGGSDVQGNLNNRSNNIVKEFPSTDNNDGSYEIILDVNEKGSYLLSIVVNDEDAMKYPHELKLDSWRLDPSKGVGQVRLLDKNLGFRGETEEWGSIVGTSCFSEGLHSWKAKVVEFPGSSSLGVGVCLENDHIDNSEGLSQGNKWTWWCKKISTPFRQCRYSPAEGVSEGHEICKFQEGDILTLFLDCEKRTLTLTNERSKLTEIHSDVGERVTPFFRVRYEASITLL